MRDALAAMGPLEIIVVDDGSDDGTAAAAAAAGADEVVSLPTNRGKGAAVRAGMARAHGTAVGFTDADLAYPPGQLAAMVTEVEAGAEVVVGSRRHRDSVSHRQTGLERAVAGRAFSWLCRALLLTDLSDTQCGLKVFSAPAAADLFGSSTIDGFAFDVEILYLAGRRHYRIVEVPVELTNPRRSSVHAGRHLAGVLRDVLRLRLRTLARS